MAGKGLRWGLAALLGLPGPAMAYWVERVDVVEGEPTSIYNQVHAVDLDGDRRLDLLVMQGAGANRVVRYLQQPDGQLAGPVLVLAGGGEFEGITAAFPLDFNRDGRMDVAVGNGSGLVLLLADGAGGYTRSDHPTDAYPRAITQLAAYDVDEDGVDDLVGLGGSGVATVYYASGGDTVDHVRVFAVPTEGANDMAVGDVDHDGRPDLVLSSNQRAGGTHLQVLGPDGAGGLAVRTQFTAGATGLASIVVADFDGDGLQDIVGARAAGAAELWKFTLGPDLGVLAFEALATEPNPGALAAGDLDGDGRTDLAVFHNGWLSVGYYLQGTGGLQREATATTLYAGGIEPRALAIGDLDGDGCGDFALGENNRALHVGHGTECSVAAPSVDLEVAAQYSGQPPGEYGGNSVLDVRFRVTRAQYLVDDALVTVRLRPRDGTRIKLVNPGNRCQRRDARDTTVVLDCLPWSSRGQGEDGEWQVYPLYFDPTVPLDAEYEVRLETASVDVTPGNDQARGTLRLMPPETVEPLVPVDRPALRPLPRPGSRRLPAPGQGADCRRGCATR